MLDPRLADELRTRPAGSRAMTQRWSSLCFIHYTFEPEIVQATLPPGLTVDTFPDADGNEMAWVGLVPFRMQEVAFGSGLRVAVPTAVNFLETNVRTYVHREGREPGVWFYSLEASSLLASKSARLWYGLPYWFSRMTYAELGSERTYTGTRLSGAHPSYRVEVSVGSSIPSPRPGSLEFFLVERYLLYSEVRGRLMTGRVFHSPYPVHEAKLVVCEDGLVPALGLPEALPCSVLYSPGVDVDVFRLR